jgi:alpha-D-ribose 1-methylphosphonate 5-triphosphate synthase subunit PhnG
MSTTQVNLHTVLPPAGEVKFVGEEPTWVDGVTDEKYNGELHRGLNWHNYCASEKNYRKYLEEWIREHHPATAKEEIALWRDVNKVYASVCAIARCHMQGFPLNDRHIARIENYIATWNIKQKKTRVKNETSEVKTVTIQDRIQTQVRNILSELDVCVDNAFDGEIPTTHDMMGTIASSGVNLRGPQLKLVTEYLKKNLIEWEHAYNKQDEQLVEGYAYVGHRNFKKIIDEFNSLLSALSQQQTAIQSQRIRKKKPVDKKKMANKLRFMKEFADLGIKSLNPVDIIGANTVWVYDTKKRKLGYYEAEAKNSLYVKGTSIHGYKLTCEKILRKPDEQLPEMMKLRKNQTVNWFDTIKAKCKDMTGRTNLNLILLRID